MEIDKIAALRLEPEDILVLSYPGILSEAFCKHLQMELAKIAPGNKIAVLQNGMMLQVLKSVLKWTTDLPTQEGFYWLSYEWQGTRKSEVVEVYQYPDGLGVRFGGTDNDDEPIGNITPTNEWYGPIEPPEYS